MKIRKCGYTCCARYSISSLTNSIYILWVNLKMTIHEMIKQTEYRSIQECVHNHYGNYNILEVNNSLINLQQSPNLNNATIHISAFAKNASEIRHVENFNENDKTLFFDVAVTSDDDDEIARSISVEELKDILGFFIDEQTLLKFSYPTILAHCLYSYLHERR